VASQITLCGSLSRWSSGLGAAMHEAGYRALGLDWRYVPFETRDLAGALTGMRALSIRGLGVSMPYKIEILPLLDRVDALAERIGAVNTVVNDGGTLIGHNTDWLGAVRALEEKTELEGRRILLLGAGGAAKAVGHGLKCRAVDLLIANRHDDRGAALAELLGASHRQWDARADLDGIDVVVNASSAGMSNVDAASPMPAGAFSVAGARPLVVMDIVYKPLMTSLIAAAEEAGAITVHGGRMLLHQAARQFELYTEQPAPLAAMDEALVSRIS
jgi:shikimate dehydrogenase